MGDVCVQALGRGAARAYCPVHDLIPAPADFILAFGLSPQRGLPSSFRPSHLPRQFSSQPEGQELSQPLEPGVRPWPPPGSLALGLVGARDPEGLGGSPLPFPRLGPGPLPGHSLNCGWRRLS